jgi:hypothetical protein
MFWAAGPGIRGSDEMDDIDIIQIAPMILSLLDVPPGDTRIPIPRLGDLDPWERAQLEENLIGLGALDPRSLDAELAVEQAICQRLFHRAQRCYSQSDFE